MLLAPLDPSKLSKSWISEYFPPFISGCVFVGVCLFLRDDLVSKFFQPPSAPDGLKIAAVIGGAFVSGYVIFVTLAQAMFLLFFIIGVAIGNVIFKSRATSESGNMVWRRLVRTFTDNTLVPVEEPAKTEEEMKAMVEAIKKTLDPTDSTEQLTKKIGEPLGMQVYRAELDGQWRDVYQMLQGYFYEPNQSAVDQITNMFSISCAAFLAIAVLHVWNGFIFASGLVVLLIGVMFAVILGIGSGGAYVGTGGQAARILRDIKRTTAKESAPSS